MARPTKRRRVCAIPEVIEFNPDGRIGEDVIVLTVDEFETIRLIDKEGLSQEECGVQLGVGRTTAQKIYETARKKIADAIVGGISLRIQGGEFEICSGRAKYCYRKECIQRTIHNKFNLEKGDNIMRIAVTYENGQIFQHFGHTEQFKIYDVENGQIKKSAVVDTNGQGHGALVGVLSSLNVDVLICGGIGGGARTALSESGIKLYGGVCGNADKAVQDYIDEKLAYNPDVQCNHHDHEHGEEGHKCGNHGCGRGSCGDND